MLPPIGPVTFSPAPLAQGTSARLDQGAAPGTGETSASGLRPETAQRVDPPRALAPAPSLPDRDLRRPDLVAPDPDPPTGPPPAFEATPLERQRQQAFLRAAEKAAEPDRPAAEERERTAAEEEPAETKPEPRVPTSPSERMASDVRVLRDLGPSRSVDLLK